MDRARRRATAAAPSRAESAARHPPGTRHGERGEHGEAPAERQREQLREQVEALRTEVEQLRQASASRPVIDQARGMVMALAPCDAQTAWWVLVRVSQHSNVKLRRVAGALVAGAEGTPVPEPVRKALAAALHRVRTASR
ncbi:ANTAR domain-containing protein [Streptomyces reniochalinae]|uniref:ANTAR domain-containing protein n=1 Tax=Streptomyces reniochalinae TaxID=2250578 RepID=UPI001FE9086F|nr:ANTAR domain-containing protein [Streptomyces reniochalinae]